MSKLSTILFASLLMNTQQASQTSIYTKLHEHIYRINNQYFYSEKVHTYLINLEDKILLFDIPTYSTELEKFILSFNKPIFAILSHGSCGIEDGTKWQAAINLKVYAHQEDENHPWIRMKPDVLFTIDPKFDKNIEVIHTPGHSAGSICVLDKSTKSLFTGDTFYGDKNGNIRDITKERQSFYENLEDRIRSCKSLLNYDFENVYPFHYEIIEGKGKEALQMFLADK